MLEGKAKKFEGVVEGSVLGFYFRGLSTYEEVSFMLWSVYTPGMNYMYHWILC
jgi:hypothetical protein